MNRADVLTRLATIGAEVLDHARARSTPHERDYYKPMVTRLRAAWKAVNDGADPAAELASLRWHVPGAWGRAIAAMGEELASVRAA